MPSGIGGSGGVFLRGRKSNEFAPMRATLPVFAYRQKLEAGGRAVPAPSRPFPRPPGQAARPYIPFTVIQKQPAGNCAVQMLEYRTGRSSLPYGKQARGNVAGGLAVVSFKSPFLPPDANRLGGAGGKKSTFRIEGLGRQLPVSQLRNWREGTR